MRKATIGPRFGLIELCFQLAQGHEYFNPQIKPRIFLHACAAEMAPKLKK
jgi:hypothetical protein